MVTAIAAAAAYTFLVLLPFTRTHAGADEVERLSLPPLWSFSADLSFPSSSPSSLNSYSHIAPFSLFVPILSSAPFASGSKGFSFGFLSLFPSPTSPPSQIFLSICLGVQQGRDGSSTPFLLPVWSLNTIKPLKQQGKALVMLKVDDNEQLSLSDGDGRVVWTLSKVHSMEMQRNGNLVIIDSSNESIWQSFEHPSDCLLEGQQLRMGMEMTSSNNMYKAAMQAGGPVFYQVSANPQPLMYDVFPANKTVEDLALTLISLNKDAPINLTSSLRSPSCAILNKSMAYFVLDGDRVTVHDACANTNIINKINATTDLLRLDADGVLRDYYVQQLPNSSYEVTSTMSNYRPCVTPNVCGAYGVCSWSYTAGTNDIHSHGCRCLNEQDNKNFSNVFTFMDISNPSQGCTRTLPLECEQVSSQSLVEIQGVLYTPVLFSLFELTWKDNTKSLQDCKASCLSNCSCSGLLYHTKSSFCLPFGDTTPLSNVSFIPISSQEHIAFVKIQLAAAKFKSHSTILAVKVTVPVVVLIIILVSAIYWKWKKRMDPESKLAEEELLGVLSTLPTRYSYGELTRFTQGFSKRLGSGGFGSVYEGVLPDGRRVAVKNLDLPSQGQKEFLAEIAAIGGISHVNIVNLYGFCLEKRHRLLVYEYMENGSLDKWLFCKEGEQQMHVLTWETRYNVALGTARGLAYLHEECPKPILHFDVKPQNVLLDGNLDAKLGDFGLAKLVAREQSSVITVVRGTPGYIAPELVSRLIVSKKCDVYSFGMVLLELVSGRKNVELGLMGIREDWYFPKWAAKKAREGTVAELMDKRLVGTVACEHEASSEDSDSFHQDGAIIMEQVKTVVRVALSCIHEEPEMRPSMTMVCAMLEGSIGLPNDIPAGAIGLPFDVPAAGATSGLPASSTGEVVYSYSSIQGR